MLQPIQPEVTTRNVQITCFTCNKNLDVELKSWQTEKKIICPVCLGKQAIIISSSIKTISLE